MVEETLKRLLEAERQAERIVQQAETEREQAVHRAMQVMQAAEQQAEHERLALYETTLRQASLRAEQSIAELRRHQLERLQEVEALARMRRAQAAEAVWRRFSGQG